MSADDKCPAHYSAEGEQHWTRIWRLYGRGYFVGSATGYVERYHKKNGIDDLEKAIHFLEKLCELEKAAADGTGPLGAEGVQPPLTARDEVAELRTIVNGMADRIAAQSDLLSKNAEGSKQQWLDRMAGAGVRVVTPHENVHGYVVREGVLWCPHCGCPHDSFDPFEGGLTCAQCMKPLTTFDEEECDQCNGKGVVADEWHHGVSPCPKCQASYEG